MRTSTCTGKNSARLFAVFLFLLATAIISQAQTNVVPDNVEFQALKALYDSLGGSNWTTKTNWPTPGNWPSTATNSQFGTWYGVTVTNGDISKIAISNKNLVGMIPSKIGDLQALVTFDLNTNVGITGKIPTSLASINSLKDLYLYRCTLTGSIASSIFNLPNLSTLNVSYNQLTGGIPSNVGNAANLVNLVLASNPLGGTIPSNIGNLTKLSQLILWGNQLTGNIPSSLGNLVNLNFLRLDNNQLTGGIPIELGNLTKLSTGLYLYSNKLTGSIPTELCNLSNLIDLQLQANLLTGIIPSSIGNLTKLTNLSLGTNKLIGEIPSTIGNLGNLVSLNLSVNQLSGSIPSSIGNLSKLTSLVANTNQLSGSIPSSFGNMTNLTSIQLSSNRLTGNLPSELGNLFNLTSLQLYSNLFSGTIPPQYGNLAKLNTLYLSDNKLIGQIPSEIGNLSKLVTLYLHMNQLEGELPASLGNLTNLTRLYVYSNQLAGELPSTLGNLVKLQYFYASNNQFSGSLPASLSNWTQIYYFYIDNNKFSGQLPDNFFSNYSKLGLINLKTNYFTGPFPSSVGSSPLITTLIGSYNQFTSLPNSILTLAAPVTIQFDYNELISIPNFAGQANKINLQLLLGNNRLDFSQLEPMVGAGIKSLSTLAQKTINDVLTQPLTTSTDLILTARPKGSFTSNIKWEKLQPNGATWSDVSSSNADALTGNTYRIVNATSNAEGKYRWSCTSTTATGFTLTSDPIEVKTPERFTIDNLAFQYKYDGRKRMIAKKVPGAEWVYMVYDDRDRLVLTQDAEQRKLNKWSFTKYDELNRPILTGIRDTTVYLSQAQMQSVVNAHFAKPSARWSETFIGSAAGNVHGYSNKAYPVRTGTTTTEVDANKYLTITYFDNYSFRSLWPSGYNYINDGLAETVNSTTYNQPATEFSRVSRQITGTKTKVLDGGNAGAFTFLKSVNYYDDKYRVIQTTTDNYQEGTERVSMLYDFTGKTLKTIQTHVEGNIIWKDLIGATVDGNRLLKTTAGSSWNTSGAASTQQLAPNTDGWIEWTAQEKATYRVIGLSNQNVSNDPLTIQYGLYLRADATVHRYESGSDLLLSGGYTPGDVFRIERISGTINYRKNGVIISSSPTPTTSALLVDVSLYSSGGTVPGIRSSFSITNSTITRTFNYDHAGRLLKTWHSVNGATPILLAQNEYNELGQLVDKKLYSTEPSSTADNQRHFKQSIDYRYNIRGWLTRMNNSDVQSSENTIEDDDKIMPDLFGMNLHYNDLVTGLTATSDAQYNGNISAIQYSNNQALGTVKSHGYKFGYDPMNRLLSATHKERTGAWNASGSYQEDNLTYDLNGNIKSLSRRGENTSLMDILSYDYGAGSSASNKLLSVSDSGDKTKGFIDGNIVGDDYTYDANGNMVIDKNKSIITSAGAAGITYNYLNLPEKVVKSNGDYIKYVYDASGRKLSQGVYTSANVLKKKTDYVGEYFYENDTLKFINHEEGRVVMTSLSPGEGQGEAEYQYNMKDRLGNVRMTFTTKDDIQANTATLETANGTTEQGQFLNYDEAIKINSLWFDHSHRTAGGASNTTQYATRLTGGNTNATIGLAKSLSVMPGDKIDVEVFAKYLDPNPNNLTQALKDFIASIATGGGAPGGTIIDGGFAGSLGNNVFPFAGFFTHSSESSTSPKAYLNYLVFDRNYVFKTGGYKRVTTAAIETGTDGLHERLYFDGVDQIKITEPGYIYIWLSNENETAVEVYFDDFKVTHTKSPVIATNDYYPFGLTFNSYSRENAVSNQYKYNGMELQDELNLGWYDYLARQYDPTTGRFLSVDPAADLMRRHSPYNYAFDNPLRFTDPDGMIPEESTDDPNKKKQEEPASNPLISFLSMIAEGLGMMGETANNLMPGDEESSEFENVMTGLGLVATLPMEAEQMAMEAGETSEASTVSKFDDVAKTVANKGDEIVSLGTRATQIHKAVPAATQRRTTIAVADAVGSNGESVRLVGSSEARLRPAQRATMAPGEIEATGTGHAEATILNYASQNGYTVQGIGASRPICFGCQGLIQGAGATATTPLKAWKGVPYK
jgi:RHS repeat-associated protein